MNNKVVENILVSRTALFEILIAGFFIGVCASITGSILFEELKPNILFLTLGVVLVLIICIWLLSKKFTKSGKASISVHGFIIYLNESKRLKSVPRYCFSESICRHIDSAFSENEALKRQWENEPPVNAFSNDKGKSADASLKLVREAAEYYVIEKLSTHLTDYFNKQHYDKSDLIEFSRADVPSILLSNRFLELFSAPMENRAVFDPERKRPKNGIIIMSMGKGGAFYSKFDLVLPKGAKVTRENDAIVIETSSFKLTMAIHCEGTGYVTPRNFEKHYLGLDSYRDYRHFKVRFEADVEFKLLATLKKSKWNYHAWLDGFFHTVERDMSGDKFFSQIAWETVATMIQCGNVMPNKLMQPTAEAATD